MAEVAQLWRKRPEMSPRTELLAFADCEWVAANLHLENVEHVDLTPTSGAGGLGGAALTRMVVSCRGATAASADAAAGVVQQRLMLKTGRSSDGRAREADFYAHVARDGSGLIARAAAASTLPALYAARNGDSKAIVMPDATALGYVQAGLLFGPCSPHNWRRDLAADTHMPHHRNLPSLDPSNTNDYPGDVQRARRRADTLRVTRLAFAAAARMHACAWNSPSLRALAASATTVDPLDWLRARDWHSGANSDSWLSAQATAASAWASRQKSSVAFDGFLVSCVDASLAKTDWTAFQERVHSPAYHYTLVHGDFHPANAMYNPLSDSLKIIDWEVVGIGSGPQDLSQFLISHMYPEERRMWEMDLLREYYDLLIKHGQGSITPSQYSFEQCKADYVAGGVARWVWLLAILVTLCPDEWVQYFHDQLLAFIKDHGVTPETIEMPRV
ncbi:hypothetical protein HDU83_003908 [Entophlyctis luteolus]|nr:hypothetical protein HDU83_003908 [Entophlyctis luteolus]